MESITSQNEPAQDSYTRKRKSDTDDIPERNDTGAVDPAKRRTLMVSTICSSGFLEYPSTSMLNSRDTVCRPGSDAHVRTHFPPIPFAGINSSAVVTKSIDCSVQIMPTVPGVFSDHKVNCLPISLPSQNTSIHPRIQVGDTTQPSVTLGMGTYHSSTSTIPSALGSAPQHLSVPAIAGGIFHPSTVLRSKHIRNPVTHKSQTWPPDVPSSTMDRRMRLYVGTNPAVPEPTGLSLLQCQLLEKLVHFLFPRNGLRTSESVVLDYLQHVWGAHEAYFRDVMKQFFVSQREVLFLWIQERRTMSSIERIIKGQPSACALDMVNRLLMMNELRILRLRWESLEVNDGNQVLSPEDLLCMTFAMMTNTEGTEDLFKDGLDMLKAGVPDFLKFKDMKIVIFSSVG